MKQRLLAILLALPAILANPAAALAQEETVHDGRLDGYPGGVVLDGGSTALMWLLLFVLAAIGLSVMFKNAHRSHLD
jgi:hypothetical protein